MNRHKLLQQMVGMVLVLLLLAGCGAPTATPTPTPIPPTPTATFTPAPTATPTPTATSTPVPPTATHTTTPTPLPPTATPTPLPPPEELLRRYDEEVRSLVDSLLAAQKPPSDFQMAPATDWQISLVPLGRRLYYAQTLLFPEWTSGSSTASTKLYIVYSYERGENLTSGKPGLKLPLTQEVIAKVRLVVEAKGKLYLIEEKGGFGGAGSRNYRQLVEQAVERLEMLEGKGEEVENIIEIIVGYACGLNWDKSFELSLQLAALQWALTSESFADRRQAAEALGEIGPEAAEAIPALIPLLEDEESMVRRVVAKALATIGPEAKEIPVLIRALDDEDYWVRIFAAEALATMGSDAKEAVPALIQHALTAGDQDREAEIEALKAITGQDFGEDATAWQRWWDEQK